MVKKLKNIFDSYENSFYLDSNAMVKVFSFATAFLVCLFANLT